MYRLSTNLTLFIRLFLPVFWTVFFALLTIVVFFTKEPYIGGASVFNLRIFASFILLSSIALYYFTLLRLKRVEMNAEEVFVSNYFKNVKYPIRDIESIHESKFLFLKVVTITLKQAGSFGKKILFLASSGDYAKFWNKHPELRQVLVKADHPNK